MQIDFRRLLQDSPRARVISPGAPPKKPGAIVPVKPTPAVSLEAFNALQRQVRDYKDELAAARQLFDKFQGRFGGPGQVVRAGSRDAGRSMGIGGRSVKGGNLYSVAVPIPDDGTEGDILTFPVTGAQLGRLTGMRLVAFQLLMKPGANNGGYWRGNAQFLEINVEINELELPELNQINAVSCTPTYDNQSQWYEPATATVIDYDCSVDFKLKLLGDGGGAAGETTVAKFWIIASAPDGYDED